MPSPLVLSDERKKRGGWPIGHRFLYPFLFPLISVSVLFPLILGVALVWGCGTRKTENETRASVDTSDIYVLEVIKDRKVKDLHFLQDEDSPLLPADRAVFTGLQYFPPDKSFVFHTKLEPTVPPRPVMLATSKNRPRPMLMVGHLPFTYKGVTYRLEVFAPKDTTEGRYWFIPFMDETNGTESYEGGRFIDIDDPGPDSTFLDFNYAYNPYCAYNHAFDCPIPPAKNRLPIPVYAGERAFRKR
ncbi:MAG: DUF1684 domain-containing protein [Bacteroidota bacterium]|nr:DUF1684 domain-containing protein [Bacteroidota bacterium]